MKNVKRILSVLLVISVLSAGFVWHSGATDAEDFDYEIRNGGAVVLRYGGADRDVTVPETLGGYTVTAIDVDAFQCSTSLVSITLPNGVTELAAEQFSSCTSLKAVRFGNNVRKLGASTFWNCTALETIVIPDTVVSIGASAFSDCTALKTATIGNSVTSIPNDLFDMCTSLQTVYLGEGIQTVHSRAFPNTFKQKGNLFVFGENTKISAQEMVNFSGTVHCFNGSLTDRAAKESDWNVVNFSVFGLETTLDAPLTVTASDAPQTVPTEGLHVFATYIDETAPEVSVPKREIASGYAVPQTYTFSAAGTVQIPVTYDDFSTSFLVTVRERVTQTGIEIVSAPHQTVYYTSEQMQTLDTDGLCVELVCSDGSRTDVTRQCDVPEKVLLRTAGTEQIAVTYGAFSASFSVTVQQTELRFAADGAAASGVYKKKIGLFSSYRKNPVTLTVNGIDEAQVASVRWEIIEGSGMRVDESGELTYANLTAGTGVVRATVTDVHGVTHTAELRVIFYRLNIQLPLRFGKYT